MVSQRLAARLLQAVDDHGVLLVHDQVLPSITAIAVGEPVKGSWWAHPRSNDIYNALGAIEDSVLSVKLIRRKDTLVARRLWSAVLTIATQKADWQITRLDSATLRVLGEIEASAVPVVVGADDRPRAAKLAERLLVHATEVHSPGGHHVKAFTPWDHWASTHHVCAGQVSDAVATIEHTVAAWRAADRRTLLPWPHGV